MIQDINSTVTSSQLTLYLHPGILGPTEPYPMILLLLLDMDRDEEIEPRRPEKLKQNKANSVFTTSPAGPVAGSPINRMINQRQQPDGAQPCAHLAFNCC